MRRQFPVGLFAAMGIITTGALIGAYMCYSRPNLAGRPTDELMQEIITDASEHCREPFAFQLIHVERQRFITAEIARRTPIRLARLRVEAEAVDLNPHPTRVISMVNPASACP